MKQLLFASLFILSSCASKVEKDDIYSKKFDTSGTISAFYLYKPDSLFFKLLPAKRVIRHYMVQDGLDSVTVPGKYVMKVKPITDTLYLIATLDSTVILKDSTGHQIPDKQGHTQYLPSFRKPTAAPAGVIQETRMVIFPTIK